MTQRFTIRYSVREAQTAGARARSATCSRFPEHTVRTTGRIVTNGKTQPRPVSFEQLSFDVVNDARLLMEAVGRLAMGIQPLTQWAPVFANPDLLHWPGLRSKAFTVWFPTMLDFVGFAMPEMEQVRQEVQNRDLDPHDLFEIADEASNSMRQLLSMFSKEEQIYLNDRRLQNVHGLVSQFFRPAIGVKWYEIPAGRVVQERMDDEAYHDIMRSFYPSMQAATLDLLDRCVISDPWGVLHGIVHGRGSMASIDALAKQLADENGAAP